MATTTTTTTTTCTTLTSSTERRRIPRPWLDRLRTPSFQEQKPDIIWEGNTDNGTTDSWEEPTNGINPMYIQETTTTRTRCIVSPLQDFRKGLSVAPRVIYIVHDEKEAWPGNKLVQETSKPLQEPMPVDTTAAALAVPIPVQRTVSLPTHSRPPRMSRQATGALGKPPLRPRAPTCDSSLSRHRRSLWEPLTTESLSLILDPDDASTIVSSVDGADWMMQWAMQREEKPSVYLPTCPEMMKGFTASSILLSGWLAVCEEEPLVTILPKHVVYMIVLQTERALYFESKSNTGQSSSQERERTSKRLAIPPDAHVEMVLQPLGKAVLIMHGKRTLCMLLPVALPLEELGAVSTAQHDAALHLLFALDSWIRRV